MSKFVLIGGGENGREGTEYETENIDKEIVRLTNKINNVKFLFLAHGNQDEDSYYEIMKKIYTEKFRCICDILKKENILTEEIVIKKLQWADIIYVGGGNTEEMMNLWKKTGFDNVLKIFLTDDKVFCGISAGAICWCKCGVSDSKKKKEEDPYVKVNGLNIFNILFCPSYDERCKYESNLESIMQTSDIPMLALEKGTAIVINNGRYKIIQSLNNKKVYKSFYKDSIKYKIEMPSGEYNPIEILTQTN